MPKFAVSGSYIEFDVLQNGPASHPDLRVRIDSSFNDFFLGAIKQYLRHGQERWWDGEGKVWWIAPDCLDKMIELAKDCHFKSMIKIEGDEAIDLETGEPIPVTGSLFG
jgi:hypothetical protein